MIYADKSSLVPHSSLASEHLDDILVDERSDEFRIVLPID